MVFIWCIFSTYLIGIMQATSKFFKNILDGILVRKADNFRLWKVLSDESDINSALFVFLISWWYMISLKKTCVKSLLYWVSSTTFGIPFNLQIQFYNSGSSLSVICKWLLQKDLNIISKHFCCRCYMHKNVALTLIYFAVLKWEWCLSFQLQFELPVEIPHRFRCFKS